MKEKLNNKYRFNRCRLIKRESGEIPELSRSCIRGVYVQDATWKLGRRT